ncbi:MAG: glycosyltransferase family 39 protein, partial [Myxococcota bacterium]
MSAWLRKAFGRPPSLPAVVVLATLAGLGLRLATLPDFSIGGDELWTLKWIQLPPGEILTQFRSGLTMHLYLLLLKAWSSLFGSSPAVLKVPSLVAGVASIPVLYWFGRRWTDEGAAQLAATLAAISPVLIFSSRFARTYAMLTLVALLAMSFVLQASRNPTRKSLATLTVLNFLGLALSLNFAYMLIVQAGFLCLDYSHLGRRTTLRVALSLGLATLLALGFYSQMLDDILAFGAEHRIPRYRPHIIVGSLAQIHPLFPGVFVMLSVLGALHAWRRGLPAAKLLTLCAILPPVLYLLQRSPLGDSSISRYLIPTLPAWLLLTAIGARRLISIVPHRAAKRHSVAIAAGLLLVAHAVHPRFRYDVLVAPMATSTLQAKVVERFEPGDVVSFFPRVYEPLFVGNPRLNAVPLEHLIFEPSSAQPARLLIVTARLAEARGTWSRHFEIEEVAPPGYKQAFDLLISHRLESGSEAFVDPLRTYLQGWIDAAQIR